MPLTPEQREELERRGVAYVRRQLSYAGRDDEAVVPNLKTEHGFMLRGDVATWLEKRDQEAQAKAERLQAKTLFWAKAAAFVSGVGIIVAIGIALLGK